MNNTDQLLQDELKNYSDLKTADGYDIPLICASLIKENDFNKIIHRLLLASIILSNADGGTLYVVQDDRLTIKTMVNRSLNIFQQFDITDSSKSHFIPLSKKDGEANTSFISVKTAASKKPINIEDIQQQDLYDLGGSKSFDKLHKYSTNSILTIPLLDNDETVAVIQLINCKDANTQKTIPFIDSTQNRIEQLCSGVISSDQEEVLHEEFEKNVHSKKKKPLFLRLLKYFFLIIIIAAILFALFFFFVL
jgi:GAF domain-containing protein